MGTQALNTAFVYGIPCCRGVDASLPSRVMIRYVTLIVTRLIVGVTPSVSLRDCWTVCYILEADDNTCHVWNRFHSECSEQDFGFILVAGCSSFSRGEERQLPTGKATPANVYSRHLMSRMTS